MTDTKHPVAANESPNCLSGIADLNGIADLLGDCELEFKAPEISFTVFSQGCRMASKFRDKDFKVVDRKQREKLAALGMPPCEYEAELLRAFEAIMED